MPNRVAITTLNARTIDIINTIRANASAEYQSLVPVVETERDVPRVGEILTGYPALANQFLSSLVNRIALVKIKSATFNNDYAELKKGYLEFGETVEEVFVQIAKAREFSAEKAEARELKRSVPDVKTAFHAMNWRVQYPVTVQDEELHTAFLSINGVEDLIAKIVDSVYTANEYDEYLLFKYLMIKAISHGKMFPVAVDASDAKNCAKAFRGISNNLTFMSNKYNAFGVTTNTKQEDQYIFMDSFFNASYDVDVLAGAFNMDKAEFIGKLKLIDDWSTFDNARFDVIRANSDMIEEVTAEELELCKNVKAVIVDKEYFQIYDNLIKFTEKNVASGMYWNYFLNVWKTVSTSPFSNAVVFVDGEARTGAPDTFTATVTAHSADSNVDILVVTPDDGIKLNGGNVEFAQTAGFTEHGVAVHKYGAFIAPATATKTDKLVAMIGNRMFEADKTLAQGIAGGIGTEYTFADVNAVPNTLLSLIVGDTTSGQPITLTPTFASDITAYTATATLATGVALPVSILATATDNKALITKTVDGAEITGVNANLEVGEHLIDIAVKGIVDGEVAIKHYFVTVTVTGTTAKATAKK